MFVANIHVLKRKNLALPFYIHTYLEIPPDQINWSFISTKKTCICPKNML